MSVIVRQDIPIENEDFLNIIHFHNAKKQLLCSYYSKYKRGEYGYVNWYLWA